MTPPDPAPPDPKDTLAALIEAFTKLPPLLSYGGLVLVAAIVLVGFTGVLPDALLAVPVAVIVAFLVYAYLSNRFEMEKERLKANQEADRLRHQAELEQLKLKQSAELELTRLKQEGSLKRAELKAARPTPPPPTQQPDDPPSADTWPASYYRYVWQKSAQLHMTSIDPRAQELGAAVLNLHSVFVALDVPAAVDRDEMAQARALRDRREAERFGREPALMALSRPENDRLALLGQPGSGKSTLVKYLALCLSGEGLREAETNLERLNGQDWNLPALLPVVVVLRDYAARGLPKKQSLWAFIAAALKQDGLANCARALDQQLKQNGGILLLDGLDEVPEAYQRREQLRGAILLFVRDFPQARILVTSRPYAYQNPAWQLPGFSQTTLLDFTSEQIESYIDRWYAVAAPLDPNLGEERAQQYASQLKRQVEQNRNLSELAPRPLLLALMVSLHRWRGGGMLPERREQLYDHSVNLMLDLWQKPKLILDEQGQPGREEANALTELGIDTPTLRRALSQLACEVHHDQPDAAGTADISHEKLVAALRAVLPREIRDAVPYQKVADYVRDRAGLLEDRGEGVYGFPHRTFQEYLAAMHLLDQEEFPANIVPLARQDPGRWREAALLAGNSAQTTLQWALVEQLYEREDAPQDDRPVADAHWWGAFLAGQVLRDSDLLAKETRLYKNSLAQVKEWHKAILARGALPPRDRAQAGDLLAALGDDRPGVLAGDDMPLCYVPAGEFWMGDSEKSDQGQWTNILNRPYWLAQYPVTVAQFREFVQDSERKARDPDSLRGPLNCPVVWVNWYDALAFCDWLNRRWQKHLPPGYRVTLPNEPEWEKAARGGRAVPVSPHVTTVRELKAALDAPPAVQDNQRDGRDLSRRRYPWGDGPPYEELRPGHALYRANYDRAGVGRPSAVGSFPAGVSPAGGLDLSGNVWEWTRSYYGKKRPYRLTADYETTNRENEEPVLLCGGDYYAIDIGCSARYRSSPHDTLNDNGGFRVVVSPFVSDL